MKDQLIFDVTDANTIADSDSVGAFLRASDGTLLTHTDVGGKKALDVRVAEGINVEVDLSHVDDSVQLGDGTTLFTGTTVGADHGLDVNLINASIAVTATDLDIRDISHTQDSIQIGDGTDLMGVNADGSINAVVTATQLDIDDLNAATDSVASHLFDGAGTALTSTLVGADQALDVNLVNTISINDAALANTAIASAKMGALAASTIGSVVASALTDRKYLSIYNADNRKIYIGDASVTVADGFPLSPGAYMEMRAGASVDVKVISEKLNHDVRTLELS